MVIKLIKIINKAVNQENNRVRQGASLIQTLIPISAILK